MTDEFIGNYRVIRQIGAGGMAKVYLAVHREIANLKVILKILSDPRLVERFKQEADKLALLDGHPNICRIKHFFTHGEDVVIAMEYIDGVTLDDKLKEEGKLTVEEALKITADILDILAFAHQHGVFHRDIKPGNIMIDLTGTVKIIDFGIAKAKSDPNLTIAGTACGTPAYMAPEQFTPSDDTDYAKIDIYAVGTTLFRMLTDDLPFKGDNEFALRDAKMFQEPVRPRSLVPSMSKELEACILRAINKDPGERYSSAKEMRESVLAVFGQGKVKQQEKTQDVLASGGRPKRRKSSAGRMIGVVAAVLVAAFAGYFFWPQESSAPGIATLMTPIDGAILTVNAQPELTWEANTGEGASFIIEYAGDSQFGDGRTIAGVLGQSFIFPSALENGTYFWRVYTVSAEGERVGPSAGRSFVLNATEVEAAVGSLALSINPRGDLYLNDELVGRRRTSLDTSLNPGSYDVRIVNTGSLEGSISRTVQVLESEITRESVGFTFATPAPPEPGPGEVRVGSHPRGATLYVDGGLADHQTPYTFTLEPGRHIIRATLELNDRQMELADTLVVIADSTHRVMFEFE